MDCLYGETKLCHGGWRQKHKFSSYFLEGSKKYLATGKLGVITDSGDADGNIIQENPVTNEIEGIDEAISRFIGTITQVPPMYSAIKVDGRPLYKYARAGKTVEVPKREVQIFYIKLIDKTADTFTIEVYCSKGTYIRTLVEDIGQALGCGAHVTMLRRIEERVARDKYVSTSELNQILRDEIANLLSENHSDDNDDWDLPSDHKPYVCVQVLLFL